MSHRGDSGMKLKQQSTAKGGTADTRDSNRQLCPKLRTAHAATPTNTEPMAHVTWTSTKILIHMKGVCYVVAGGEKRLAINVDFALRWSSHAMPVVLSAVENGTDFSSLFFHESREIITELQRGTKIAQPNPRAFAPQTRGYCIALKNFDALIPRVISCL